MFIGTSKGQSIDGHPYGKGPENAGEWMRWLFPLFPQFPQQLFSPASPLHALHSGSGGSQRRVRHLDLHCRGRRISTTTFVQRPV